MSAMELLPDYVQDGIHKKCPIRDDLLVIPDAEAAGWTVTFRNGSWHNCADFTKGEVSVWQSRNYRRAILRDGRYVDHEIFANIREALMLP